MKKVRDLSAKAAHNTLLVSALVLVVAVAVFSLLPVIFEEENPSPLQNGEAKYASSAKRESRFLPLIKKFNPLNYFKKAYKFFADPKDEGPQRIYYSDGTFDDIYPQGAKSSKGAQSASIKEQQEQAVASYEEQIEISPDETGYYYQGSRYSYGQYPQDVAQEDMEEAISRWHSDKAARSGRRPAYMQDEDGVLSVKYFNEKEMEDYFNLLKDQQNVSDEELAFGPQEGSVYTGYLAGRGNKMYGFGSINSFGQNRGLRGRNGGDTGRDIADQFNTLMDSAKEIEKNSSNSLAWISSQEKDSERNRRRTPKPPNLKKYLDDNSDTFSRSFLALLKSKEKTIKKVPEEFKDAPIRVDMEIYEALPEDLKNKIPPADVSIRETEKFKEDFIPEGGTLKFYSRYPLPDRVKNKFNDRHIFFNNFTNPEYQAGDSYKETFFKKSAMEEILKQLNVDQVNIKKMEEAYTVMDKKRKKINGIYPKDSKTIFVLGKDPRNDKNIIIASKLNSLYIYAGDKAPEWVKDYSKEDITISVPIEELSKKITQKGVALVTSNRETPPPFPGITSVNIPRVELVSIFPDKVWMNQLNISRTVFKANRQALKALYESKKQREEKQKKVAASLGNLGNALSEALEKK